MQRDESSRGWDSDESKQVVLRGMLGTQICDPSLETEAMKEMRDKLAWNNKYIEMLEDLVCHYQKEVNFWKGRE
jgi:DNA-dependent RNA polymerase auxiliary subunit epsilon